MSKKSQPVQLPSVQNKLANVNSAKEATETNASTCADMVAQRLQSSSNPPPNATELQGLQGKIGNYALGKLVQAKSVSQLASPAIPNNQQIQKIAQVGVQGMGQKLPYYEKLQHAFGEHDLSQIQTYTNSQAATASKAINAEAYASGNKIAFAESNPSLHTVAHETAHVVQQRNGISLYGGVGKVGDNYEQQADTVADAVVRGNSVGGFLENTVASSFSANAQSVVQRKLTVKGENIDRNNINDPVSSYSAFTGIDEATVTTYLLALIDKNETFDFSEHDELRDYLIQLHNLKKNLEARMEKWSDRLDNRGSKQSSASTKRGKLYYAISSSAKSSKEKPVILDKPIETEQLEPKRLKRRLEADEQDGPLKKKKKITDENELDKEYPWLMWTHTAPPLAMQSQEQQGNLGFPKNIYYQGKDYPHTAKDHYAYFRTGENMQREFLLQDSKKFYILDKLAFDFYQENYRDKKFKMNFDKNEIWEKYDLVAGSIKGTGKFSQSGIGSEVNAYSKMKLLQQCDRLQIPTADKDNLKKTISKGREYLDFENWNEKSVNNYVIQEISDMNLEFEENYLESVLNNARVIVKKTIEKNSQLKNYRIVHLLEKNSNSTNLKDSSEFTFFDYPSLIIEPKDAAWKKNDEVTPYIAKFISIFNEFSNLRIRLFERQSFGFLYPTISNLERSIRIWPGHLDPDYFVKIITHALKIFDATETEEKTEAKSKKITKSKISKTPESAAEEAQTAAEKAEVAAKTSILESEESEKIEENNLNYHHKTLISSLDRSLEFIKSVYEAHQNAEEITNSKNQWLHQRIVSNIAKAKIIKDKLNWGDKYASLNKPEVLFLETTQVIENLNQYGFLLSESINDAFPTEDRFKEIVKQTYSFEGSKYRFESAKLCQSGMHAGNIALRLQDAVREKKSKIGHPTYFEFAKTNPNHFDPAYNFTAQEDVGKFNATKIRKSIMENKETAVIDITNITLQEIRSVLEHLSAERVYLYGSFSKHFQIGGDFFTLGIVVEYIREDSKENSLLTEEPYMPEELKRYYVLMQGVQNKKDKKSKSKIETHINFEDNSDEKSEHMIYFGDEKTTPKKTKYKEEAKAKKKTKDKKADKKKEEAEKPNPKKRKRENVGEGKTKAKKVKVTNSLDQNDF